MRFFNKKTAGAGVVVIAIIAGSVAAYAFFTSSGTGTGTATVGSASPWVISGVGSSGGALLPGSGTQTVSYTVTNGSDGQQQLNSVVVSIGDDGSGNVLNTAANNAPVAGCLATWFAVDNAGAPASQNLAGGASVDGAATVTMTDSGTNQDPCQGVSPELVVTAT